MKLKNLLFYLSVCIASYANAQDLTIHVDKKGKVGFVDNSGTVVVKCIYDGVQPFKDGVAIINKSDKYGLIDNTGKVLLPVAYSSITKWTDNIYLVKDGKKMGLVGHRGNILLKPEYSLITKLNCYGKALIAMGGKAVHNPYLKKNFMVNSKFGIVNSEGKVLVDALYKGLYEFSFEGKSATAYTEGKRLEFRYHATVDTLVTNCEYLGFSSNTNNIYGCGIIDGNGKQILAPKLYSLVMEPKNDMVRYYNSKKKKTECGYHNLSTGKGFCATTVNMKLDDLNVWSHGDFHGDMAAVKKDGTWSFVDKNGNVKRSGYTGFTHSASLKLWSAQKTAGGTDVFDEQDNVVSSLSEYQLVSFPANAGDSERFVVKKDGKFGCVTRTGSVTVPFEYDAACASSYDVFAVMKQKKWGLVSVDNAKLIPTEYLDIVLPGEANAKDFWVMKEDSLFYHYNVEKNALSLTGYKRVANFIDGVAYVAPTGMKLEDNQITRAQLYAPNTSLSEIAAADLEKSNDAYGILLRNDDTVLVDKPVSTLYVDAVKNELKKLDGKKPTETEVKKIMLEVTKENRSYNLNSTLDEMEWDY